MYWSRILINRTKLRPVSQHKIRKNFSIRCRCYYHTLLAIVVSFMSVVWFCFTLLKRGLATGGGSGGRKKLFRCIYAGKSMNSFPSLVWLQHNIIQALCLIPPYDASIFPSKKKCSFFFYFIRRPNPKFTIFLKRIGNLYLFFFRSTFIYWFKKSNQRNRWRR